MKTKKQTGPASKKTKIYTPEEIQKKLSLLEDYKELITPSLRALVTEEIKLMDKVWYTGHLCYKNKPEWNKNSDERKKEILKSADKVLKKYGKEWLLDYENDFDWGMVLGKLEMIRWVIWGMHDCLDT